MGPQRIDALTHVPPGQRQPVEVTLLPKGDEVVIQASWPGTPAVAMVLTPANAAWLGGLLTKAARGMVI
jgi:hypothetical protein